VGRPLLHSRRTPAGITPPPGAQARLIAWWGPTDWLEAEVRPALASSRGRALCRAAHVDPDTAYTVARAHAGFADRRTGRGCRPTNARIVEAAGCSLKTVQRARKVLIELGLMVVVTEGRSAMTLAERLEAHKRQSAVRAVAAEFALCSLGRRRPRLVENRPPAAPPVDRDDPPVGLVVRTQAKEISGLLQSTDATRKAAPRPAHTGKSRDRSPEVPDLRARRLAQATQRRVSWLARVHPRRIERLLLRFACAEWSDEDVCLTIRDRLTALGKGVPVDLERPWAYLAWLLRDVDPADRPSVLENALTAARREHYRLSRHGAPCRHGVPGGDVVSPLTGVLPCPMCRAASQDRAPDWI